MEKEETLTLGKKTKNPKKTLSILTMGLNFRIKMTRQKLLVNIGVHSSQGK